MIAGVVAAALCLFTFVLLAAVLLLREDDNEVNATAIVIPTRIETATITVDGDAPATAAAAATAAIAPTVTLPGGNPPATTASNVTPPPVNVSSNVEASRLAAAPTIDGNLADWPGGIPSYNSVFRVFSHSSWNGTDDVEASWRLGWDDTNLYVAVEVTDDTHVQTQIGNQIFRGDSVDLQIDTNRDGDFGPVVNLDDFQINLSPGNFSDIPPSAFRFQGTADERILDAPGGNTITVAAQKTTTGYTLEATIPWSNLNMTPSNGLVMGLAVNVNDNDQVGQAVQEVMKSSVSTRTLTNPTSWGTLTLR
ncbi:MAG: hypothetical protein IPL78_08440 [Chloroflexi bacterium]|nr:hypothetical protein [Chloroflexota bacterium]